MSQTTDSIFPLRFENANPVAAEELLFALQLGQAAATHNMPTPSPSAKPIMLGDTDGSVTEIRFADSPQNRALLAVNKHYHDDKAKAFSIQIRIWAIAEILHHPKMQEWCKGEEIHAAIVVAAAELPINRHGKFAVKPFLKRVKEIASAHSTEELERKLLSHTA
ncbi:MAG TPA: hypothetical protein VNX88_19630 [Terriglobales bacterium]|nr:hypothetical protein [Terriglobales bacterium]